jgi:integrase
VGRRYGNKGGVWGLEGDSTCPNDRARLWLTECEHQILTLLADGRPRNRTEITSEAVLSRHTPGNLLGKLMRAGLVEVVRRSHARSPSVYGISAAGHRRLASQQWSESADLWDLSQMSGVRVPPSAGRTGRRIDFRLVPAPFRSAMKAFLLGRIAKAGKTPSLFSIKEWFAGASLFLQYYGDCFPDDETFSHLSVQVIDAYLQEQLRRWKPTRRSHFPRQIQARLGKARMFFDWLRAENEPLLPPPPGMPTQLFRRRLSFIGGKAVLRAAPRPELDVVDPRSPEDIVEAEYAKDVWDLRRLPGVKVRPQQSIHTLNFSHLPEGLRGRAELYVRYRVETEGRSPSSCSQEVRRLGQFLGWYAVQKPDARDLATLDLHDLDAYRKYLKATPNTRGSARSDRDLLEAMLAAQRLVRFLQRMELAGAPSKPAAGIFIPEVMPPAPKMTYLSGKIKYIPELVLQQIDAKCALFPQTYFAVLIVLRASGFRISDVLDLRWDKCLWQDEGGGRWLVGDINKTRILGHKVPIDNDVATVIQTQIELVKQLPERENPHRYLFPSPATERLGLPVTPGTISNALNAFVERAGIVGPDGQPFRIQPAPATARWAGRSRRLVLTSLSSITSAKPSPCARVW